MTKQKTKAKDTEPQDPDHMGTVGKVAAFVLLLLFAVYLIFFSQ